ncbi:hypothetical protein, partial [Salmonella sp. SAL4446]|uniref:hypothetical protein n=1 Tax=Salmonella sp. SAL4446 TaxID=3159901 RepID=UPI00397AD9AF
IEEVCYEGLTNPTLGALNELNGLDASRQLLGATDLITRGCQKAILTKIIDADGAEAATNPVLFNLQRLLDLAGLAGV